MRRAGTLSPSISQSPAPDDGEGVEWDPGGAMANLDCNCADRRLIRVVIECFPSESSSLACLVSPFGVSWDGFSVVPRGRRSSGEERVSSPRCWVVVPPSIIVNSMFG